MKRTKQPKPFQVSVRRAVARVLVGNAITPQTDATPTKTPAEQMGLIQGMTPGSLEEWRMAVALSQEGISFTYQVPFMGGRTVRGGTVIDFIANTIPIMTPVFVDGAYWHSNQISSEDKLKRARLDQTGWYMPCLSITAQDLTSVENIRAWIRKWLK